MPLGANVTEPHLTGFTKVIPVTNDITSMTNVRLVPEYLHFLFWGLFKIFKTLNQVRHQEIVLELCGVISWDDGFGLTQRALEFRDEVVRGNVALKTLQTESVETWETLGLSENFQTQRAVDKVIRNSELTS